MFFACPPFVALDQLGMPSQAMSKQDKPGASSLQQITARDAILLKALWGGSLKHTPTSFAAAPGLGFGLHTPSLLRAGSNSLQNGFGTPGLGQQALIPSLGSNQDLLDAVERQRLGFERMQAIRQQALLTLAEEDNPFAANQIGLRALLGDQQPSAIRSSGIQLNNSNTLKALGSIVRKNTSPYIDASSVADPHPRTNIARRRTTRGGVTEPFPEKLHRMLQEVEEAGDSDIISFFSHGRAFGVHDPEQFVSKIMPKYFKQSRLSSFQRQLNLYGFTRISSGADTGGYYHELFLKGRPALCVHMRRVGVPQEGEDRRKNKSGVKKAEPDFYMMKHLVPTQQKS
jgi:hypothetical protein